MRCVNCGWDNAAGDAVCVKCGSQIHQSHNYGVAHGSKYDAASSCATEGGAIKKTVVLDTDCLSGGKATVMQAVTNCVRCGYPIVGDVTTCPNCGQQVERNQEASAKPIAANSNALTCKSCGDEISESFAFCPKCGSRIHRATVMRPIKNVVENVVKQKPQCSITPIVEAYEKLTATSRSFEGEQIVLNRGNTEPENMTITSKEQAVLTFENGEWFIEDKSELHSTFIQVSSKRKIEDGETIVLGDRRFLFESKAQKTK